MENAITIRYSFLLEDGLQESFELTVDPQSVEIVSPEGDSLPSWTRLDYCQCPHCPVASGTYENCPAASNLVFLVSRCDKILSHDKITLEVETPDRNVSQKTTAQRALSSLIGLLMAASKCPHTAFFKPMARYHLPLASEEETIFRATASYMLAQYFRNESNSNADLSLDGLRQIYKNMQMINMQMAKRLRSASKSDSSINAIVILDMYAKALPYAIGTSLEELRVLFIPYLEQFSNK